MSRNKRDELVERALALFYREGFHATGMDLVARETGVSKTSIYKHFRTKEELIAATLDLRDTRFRAWLFDRMAELAPDPAGQILAMFDALAEWFADPGFRGCMFVRAAGEYPEAADPIHAQAARHKALLLEHLAGLAREAGLPASDALAGQVLILKEGAIVLAAITGRPQVAAEARAAAAVLLGRG